MKIKKHCLKTRIFNYTTTSPNTQHIQFKEENKKKKTISFKTTKFDAYTTHIRSDVCVQDEKKAKERKRRNSISAM